MALGLSFESVSLKILKFGQFVCGSDLLIKRVPLFSRVNLLNILRLGFLKELIEKGVWRSSKQQPQRGEMCIELAHPQTPSPSGATSV